MSITLYQEGQCIDIVCRQCRALARGQLVLREMPVGTTQRQALVFVCQQCDEIAFTPDQSAPALWKPASLPRKTMDTRLPAHYWDMVSLCCMALDTNLDFCATLMKYYIHLFTTGELDPQRLSQAVKANPSTAKASLRMSFKGRRVLDDLDIIKTLVDIQRHSDIVQGVILVMYNDLVEVKDKRRLKALRNVVAAVI